MVLRILLKEIFYHNVFVCCYLFVRHNDLLDNLCSFHMNLLLQNGPNTSTQATVSAYPPNIQAAPSHYEQRPPSVQVPDYDKGPPNVPDPKKFDYSDATANNSMSSGSNHPNSKPQGMLMIIQTC